MKTVSFKIDYPNPLVNKYLNNFPEVRWLYEHSPYDNKAFAARYNVIKKDYYTDRRVLVRILREYNEGLGCGSETRENLKKLENPDSVVVITGQQAGVFTGPLYTVYKAITAIQLAKYASEVLNKDVIPVFWVAAEDHDYAEVDHIDLINNKQELERLRLEYDPPGKYSVGNIPITDAVYSIIEKLDTVTNPSEWKGELISKLKELARSGGNLADWFASTMTWLFRKQGLIIVNPLNRDLRQLWSGVFETFLYNTDNVNQRLRQGIERVTASGARPQVDFVENNANMFLYIEGERLPLLKIEDSFQVRGRDAKWQLKDLIEIARTSPERLSPNVVLRPVAQDALLPILAYIAGPGEISYYALYRDIYPLFNQSMPIIFPRSNITIVERGIARNMKRYGVGFEDVISGIKRKLDCHLEEMDLLGIEEAFGACSSRIEDIFDELVKKIVQLEPELEKHGNESLNKILYQVDYLKKKTQQYHRKSCDIAVKRFKAIENNLFPGNNFQERVFNIFSYLFKYGPDFVENLSELDLIGDTRHKLVYFED